MALDTVQEMVTEARVLLQDTVPDYRYSDSELVSGLNLAITEASRYRTDFWLKRDVPTYAAVDSTAIDIPATYRVPFLYFVVGWAQLRDEEDVTDARASGFIQSFRQILTG